MGETKLKVGDLVRVDELAEHQNLPELAVFYDRDYGDIVWRDNQDYGWSQTDIAAGYSSTGLEPDELPSTTLELIYLEFPDKSDGNDPVNSPSHYRYKGFEVIDVLTEAFSDDPLLWQVGKYLLRAKRKGNELQDLKKALFYLERKIACLSE